MRYIVKSFIAAAIVGFAPLATAQLLSSPTVVVNASVTSNTPSGTIVIDVRRQQNVAVEWSQQLAGAGTTLSGISFVPSVDGVNISSSPINEGFMMARAASGTNVIRCVTNWNVKGYSFLICNYITNGNAQAMTNNIRWWLKPSAP